MTLAVVYSNFGGMVVSETRGGVESDYICDTLGSTIGLMDSAGTMTDRWEYWPFGEVVSRTGTSVTPLTFVGVKGYFLDILNKLFYVRARQLRVDLARWLTVDPLWPGEAAYRYVRSNPSNATDPLGLWPWDPCGIFLWQYSGPCTEQEYNQCSDTCGNACSPLLLCYKAPFTCSSTCVCGMPTPPCTATGATGANSDCFLTCLVNFEGLCDSYDGMLLPFCLAFIIGWCALLCNVIKGFL